MSDHNTILDAPIEPSRNKTLLENIQGNIMQAHGRKYTTVVLIRFKEGSDKGELRRRLAEIVMDAVEESSAFKEWERRREEESTKIKEPLTMLLLSAYGYDALGLDSLPSDPYFGYGMKHGRYWPGRAPVREWESKFQAPIHALMLFASNKKSNHRGKKKLFGDFREVGDKLEQICDFELENGRRFLDESRHEDREHFGYRDSISQPIFLADRLREYRGKRTTIQASPEAPPRLVLTEDSSGSKTYGSYMAFQKLEQNVAGFEEAVDALADRLRLRGAERDGALAMVVGRYPDGRPLSRQPMSGSDLNDFSFGVDPEGTVCPFHAHIRKMNPRGDGGRESAPRIARRSALYGDRDDLGSEEMAPPRGDVGILFMSFQADLAQFVGHQRRATGPDFPKHNTGVDALIGGARSAAYPAPAQSWPDRQGSLERFRFGDFVTMKGGEYFFAPSIPFLEKLSGAAKSSA